MRIIVVALLSFVAQVAYAACNGGSTNPASPDTGTTVSQTVDGATFTWGFTCSGGVCQCGYLRDGSPWVRHPSGGNVSIDSVSPDDANSGLQKNPGIGVGGSTQAVKNQGLLVGASEAPYVASLDISDELPYLAAPDNGVYVKGQAFTGGSCGLGAVGSICINTYATLTVLQNLPPDGILGGETFRPGASGSTKILITEDDIDLSIWPRFSQITSGSYASAVTRWNSPYPDFFGGNNGDTGQRWAPQARPVQAYAVYRAEQYVSDAYATMGTAAMTGAKQDAVYALIQYGIELYSAYALGTEWVGGAGQSQGRWLPIVIFATVYDTGNAASGNAVRASVAAATNGMSTTNTGSPGVQFTDLYQVRQGTHGWPLWGSHPGTSSVGDGCQAGDGGWYWRDHSAAVSGTAENKKTCGDPHGYIDGPGQSGVQYASCCSTGYYIQIGLLQKVWPELEAVANNPIMRGYTERIMNGAGWWQEGDQCAVRDPRELPGCLPFQDSSVASTCAMTGSTPTYWQATWGKQDDGTCVTIAEATSAGHPNPTRRWVSNHLQGRPTNLQRGVPGQTLWWDVLVPRSGNEAQAIGTITNDD